MQLLYQTHSPYARKALVFAQEAGLAGQIEVIHHETSPTNRNEAVYAQNPLGKVPVLVRPGLPPLFDSDVICEYLDILHTGRPLIPREGEARWHALRVQAVAKGIKPLARISLTRAIAAMLEAGNAKPFDVAQARATCEELLSVA